MAGKGDRDRTKDWSAYRKNMERIRKNESKKKACLVCKYCGGKLMKSPYIRDCYEHIDQFEYPDCHDMMAIPKGKK